MKQIWRTFSTSLINFAMIRRLDILEQLFGKISVPNAVQQELLEKGKDYQSATELKERWFQEITRVEVLEVQNLILDAMQMEARFWVHAKLYDRILRDNNE